MLSAVFASPELWEIIALSLRVSLSATAAAALLGLPPAVVGLALYLLLSRSGPLGSLGLLFTPEAMILAQTVLALPIVTALAHRAAEDLWREYGEPLMDLGATKWRSVAALLAMGRLGMLTAVLAGLGRTMSEVGAIIVVGGNIAGYTRTMTTAIVLETSKGDLPLALGLGLVLIGLTILISAAAFALAGRPQ